MAKKKTGRTTPDDYIAIAAKSNSPSRSGEHSEKNGGEPSDIHLAWYRAWSCEYRSISDIARDAGVGRSACHEAVHRVKEWMKLYTFENILDFRHRQTETLQVVIREALEAWKKSKEIGVTEEFESVTVDGDDPDGFPRDAIKTKRKEVHQCGGAGYLAEARAAMADIRDIWGVDMPKKLAIEMSEYDDLIDPTGLDHSQAVIDQAKAIVAAAVGAK